MAPSIDHIGLTIRGADDQVVRVEISQSGELVQVGVHTGNSDLASELRASVPELVHRLDQQGYESRVSMPVSSLSSLAAPVSRQRARGVSIGRGPERQRQIERRCRTAGRAAAAATAQSRNGPGANWHPNCKRTSIPKRSESERKVKLWPAPSQP